MANDISGSEVVFRLFLTALAAALIGFERETNSRPAGLRTTMLVALAASISMIQVNLLLTVRGKAPDSYVVMDMMRLPLGILSGMGFIGAGAILRKGSIVAGVTTAATLWFVTVMGLCFGGGQLGLGIAAALIAVCILHGLRWLERRWVHNQSASLHVKTVPDGPNEQELSRLLTEKGCCQERWSVSYCKESGQRRFSCEVHWREKGEDQGLPGFLKEIMEHKGVLELNWHRSGTKLD